METTINKFDQKTLYFSSLGCSKNLVDSQVMLGHLGLDGFQVCSEPQDAEVIIVNTCSFVEAAKIESIETILDLADFKNPETDSLAHRPLRLIPGPGPTATAADS